MSPASPTETEFGTTPIDASFGSRIDSPPDRPLPDRPTMAERSAGLLSSQRSRSGTATQADPGGKMWGGGEGVVDKYGVRMGDTAYDSDAEADDEFERSGRLSLPRDDEGEFDDDDESDHVSDSEEEDEEMSVDGEDTPTTQGWDAEGRSPMGNIRHWTVEQVSDYLIALSPTLKHYTSSFMANEVDGDALTELHHDELRELGVNSVGHRLTILKAVYEQKLRAGIKIEDHHYVPASAGGGDKNDATATQDDIARIIESIRLRDQRIISAEAELREMKRDLDRISEENRKLREETLPIMRLVKDQSTPLPDPSAGGGSASIPSPRDPDKANTSGGAGGLSRKFSNKKLWLGGANSSAGGGGGSKQPSPTHPPPPGSSQDGGYLEASSAAALAASSHLNASMTNLNAQTSPSGVGAASAAAAALQQQHSPTSPAYSTTPGPLSAGFMGSGAAAAAHAAQHHPPLGSARTPGMTGTFRGVHDQQQQQRAHSSHTDDLSGSTLHSNVNSLSSGSTLVGGDGVPQSGGGRRRQAPLPSPRDGGGDDGGSTRERGNRDNPGLEIFKSFRVSIEDPCRVVLPVALKRYNIMDDWRQYALYIVHGDQERCLGLEEKPLLLFKQLDKEGRKPMFMLRRHAAPQEGWSHANTSNAAASGGGGGGGGGQDGGGGGSGSGGSGGGGSGGGGSGKPTPGGVL